MNNAPRHCDIAIEYFTLAKELGSYEEANKHFEVCRGHALWVRLEGNSTPAFSPFYKYRRKPETHVVNGHEVPAPYRVKPGFVYYHYVADWGCGENVWESNSVDLLMLSSNNCFKSESDAEENRLAMFKLGKYAELKS